MASVEVSKLSPQEKSELACTYAALILYDDGQDITGTSLCDSGDKIGKLINSSGVKVESFWPKLFAKAIEGKDISSFFNFGGSAAGPASAPAVAATAPAAETKKAEEKGGKKKEEKKPEPPKEEEEDAGMGGLFD